MLSISYPFDESNNYVFDTDKIEVIGGKAQLKLQTGQLDYDEEFADDTNFTYDSDLAEFVGGKVQQKNQRPANATFYASYTNSINGTWGNGVLTGSGIGGASVSDGQLDLAYTDKRYVNYDANLNADSEQVGCIRFKITPTYSGAPTTDRWLFCICKAHNDIKNTIQLRHSNSGAYLRLHVYDKDGNFIVEHLCGTWNPVAGTEYEIEVDWDLTSGATRLFVDGVQNGSTCINTCLRDSNIGLLRIGSDYDAGNFTYSQFKINDFLVFDTVQHTSNYTPDWSNVKEYDYVASIVIIPEMEHTGDGTLISFDEFDTTESGSPRYTIQIGRSGDYLYWNGSTWVVSDGTYSQANDVATFNSNVGSLDVENENYGQFKVHFPNSNTQSYVDNLIATITQNTGYVTTNPTIAPSSSFNSDALASFVASVTETGNDKIKMVLSVGGINKYWNGSAWAASSGYSQSNTPSEINSNLSSLDISSGTTIKPVIYLHSDDGTTYPSIDTLTIGYDFFSSAPTSPEVCAVWGYIRDVKNEDLTSVTITIKLKNEKDKISTKHIISPGIIETSVDANGYFEVDLIRSNQFNIDGKYTVEIDYPRNKTVIYREVTVPDEASKNFWELI